MSCLQKKQTRMLPVHSMHLCIAVSGAHAAWKLWRHDPAHAQEVAQPAAAGEMGCSHFAHTAPGAGLCLAIEHGKLPALKVHADSGAAASNGCCSATVPATRLRFRRGSAARCNDSEGPVLSVAAAFSRFGAPPAGCFAWLLEKFRLRGMD